MQILQIAWFVLLYDCKTWYQTVTWACIWTFLVIRFFTESWSTTEVTIAFIIRERLLRLYSYTKKLTLLTRYVLHQTVKTGEASWVVEVHWWHHDIPMIESLLHGVLLGRIYVDGLVGLPRQRTLWRIPPLMTWLIYTCTKQLLPSNKKNYKFKTLTLLIVTLKTF